MECPRTLPPALRKPRQGKRSCEDELLYTALCFSRRDFSCLGRACSAIGNICPPMDVKIPQGSGGARGDGGVSAVLRVETAQPCSWGGWAAEQQQRLDLQLSASKANECTGGNAPVDGENTLGHCREPFPGIGRAQSMFYSGCPA